MQSREGLNGNTIRRRMGVLARRSAMGCLVLLEIFKRHIILADLLGANLPLTGIGIFHASNHTRLEVLPFLDELFHALGICLLGTRQSLRIARLPR
jgi:hypothetical protein